MRRAAVLSLLADHAERSRESLSILLTGTKEEIESKLYAHAPALRSRFKEVEFEDFSEADYRDIFVQL